MRIRVTASLVTCIFSIAYNTPLAQSGNSSGVEEEEREWTVIGKIRDLSSVERELAQAQKSLKKAIRSENSVLLETMIENLENERNNHPDYKPQEGQNPSEDLEEILDRERYILWVKEAMDSGDASELNCEKEKLSQGASAYGFPDPFQLPQSSPSASFLLQKKKDAHWAANLELDKLLEQQGSEEKIASLMDNISDLNQEIEDLEAISKCEIQEQCANLEKEGLIMPPPSSPVTEILKQVKFNNEIQYPFLKKTDIKVGKIAKLRATLEILDNNIKEAYREGDQDRTNELEAMCKRIEKELNKELYTETVNRTESALRNPDIGRAPRKQEETSFKTAWFDEHARRESMLRKKKEHLLDKKYVLETAWFNAYTNGEIEEEKKLKEHLNTLRDSLEKVNFELNERPSNSGPENPMNAYDFLRKSRNTSNAISRDFSPQDVKRQKLERELKEKESHLSNLRDIFDSKEEEIESLIKGTPFASPGGELTEREKEREELQTQITECESSIQGLVEAIKETQENVSWGFMDDEAALQAAIAASLETSSAQPLEGIPGEESEKSTQDLLAEKDRLERKLQDLIDLDRIDDEFNKISSELEHVEEQLKGRDVEMSEMEERQVKNNPLDLSEDPSSLTEALPAIPAKEDIREELELISLRENRNRTMEENVRLTVLEDKFNPKKPPEYYDEEGMEEYMNDFSEEEEYIYISDETDDNEADSE